MSGLSYTRLFNVQILHNYYADGISRKDLAVLPTAGTALAMKNSSMVFRSGDGGFRVLYKADDTGAPFIDFKNVRLVFTVQLVNINEFMNFTNLDDVTSAYTAGKILYFTNRGNVKTSELTYSLLDYLRPASFTYQFPQATGTTGHLKITNDAGADVTPVSPDPDAVMPDAANRFFYPVDFTKLPKGLYKFETWTDAAPAHVTQSIYIDTGLSGQGVFGIVDIIALDASDASFPGPADYRLYTMDFERRTSQWKYILVLKSPGTTVADTLSITDTAPQPPYGTMTFSRQPDVVVNGVDSAVFLSAVPAAPFFETPKKGLTVKKNGTDDVLNNLPGPAIGVVSAEAGNFSITQIFVII